MVACEYSGVVRDAFRSSGHNAWSNDFLPGEAPGPHIQGDCMEAIAKGWDMIVMHPPCTHLCISGNRWYGKGTPGHSKRLAAIDWTLNLWDHAKKYANAVAMENPVGVLPVKPTQYVQPWWFGHGETKKTGLWLWNLPPLMATDIVPGREHNIYRMPPSADRRKKRSKTYTGLAAAMADQWGG